MYKNKEILAIIPARGKSKRIPKKNLATLGGKPLVCHTIQLALKSALIDRIVVSTENKEIADLVKKCGAEVPFMRPKRLAGDNIGSDVVVYQQVVKELAKNEKYKPDIIVELQPTSPLRSVTDIDSVIKKLVATGADTVVTVSEAKTHPFLTRLIIKDKLKKFVSFNSSKYTRSQDFPKVYQLNGSVLAVTWRQLMKKNNDIGKDTRAFVTPPERSIDIDEQVDFDLAEFLLKKYEKKYKD